VKAAKIIASKLPDIHKTHSTSSRLSNEPSDGDRGAGRGKVGLEIVMGAQSPPWILQAQRGGDLWG
jgi:hypothetical protein